MQTIIAAPEATMASEKPCNGIKGLRHWRNDIVAGLIVSLVSLPLSLGIAVASGAPPICGIISAIIAGLIFPFIGGAYVTISGPAAGLAPIVLGTILVLGRGNNESGYHLCLVAIFIAGCVQLILSRLKAARLSAMFPVSAVEGMLASIGLLLIVKQISNLCGAKFHAHDFFPMVAEIPHVVGSLNPKVFGVGLLSLVLLFALSAIKFNKLKLIPPQLIVVVVGACIGQLVGIDGMYLIKLPADVLHGMAFPDFASAMADKSLWWPLLSCVLTLTFVDAFESLATIMAIDKIDPFHRKSDPDRTLLCMGTSNILSSMVGGLTIIPGGIKSTTCILSGGKTLWANFYNAIFLIMYIFLFRELINMIPLTVLAAVLIHIGYKLCAPKKWVKVASVGSEQLFVFASTILATLATDLLVGLLVGTAIKLAITFYINVRNEAWKTGALTGGSVARSFIELFKNPVRGCLARDGVHVVRVEGPVVCFNGLHFQQELRKIQQHVAGDVAIEFSPSVGLIDHTSMSNLLAFTEEYKRSGKGSVALKGFEEMAVRSKIETCMRVHKHA